MILIDGQTKTTTHNDDIFIRTALIVDNVAPKSVDVVIADRLLIRLNLTYLEHSDVMVVDVITPGKKTEKRAIAWDEGTPVLDEKKYTDLVCVEVRLNDR